MCLGNGMYSKWFLFFGAILGSCYRVFCGRDTWIYNCNKYVFGIEPNGFFETNQYVRCFFLKCFLTFVLPWTHLLTFVCRDLAVLGLGEFAHEMRSHTLLRVNLATIPVEVLSVGFSAVVSNKDIEVTVATHSLAIIREVHRSAARGEVEFGLFHRLIRFLHLGQGGVCALFGKRHDWRRKDVGESRLTKIPRK